MIRRDFIGNALAALGFSALPGGRLLAAPPGMTHYGLYRLAWAEVRRTRN